MARLLQIKPDRFKIKTQDSGEHEAAMRLGLSLANDFTLKEARGLLRVIKRHGNRLRGSSRR